MDRNGRNGLNYSKGLTAGSCYSTEMETNAFATNAFNKGHCHRKRSNRSSVASSCSTISDGKYFEKTEEGLKVIKGTRIARFRRRLSRLFHSNAALLLLCIVNILDTGCVLGQIITDILYVKDEIHDIEQTTEMGIDLLYAAFPFIFNETEHVGSHGHDFKRLVAALESYKARMRIDSPTRVQSNPARHRRDVAITEGKSHPEPMFEYLSESFHTASLCILSAVCLVTLMKIFAMGKRIRRNKVEVFDAFIVIVSWCSNMVLCFGTPSFTGTESAQILVFMLPWRVIRIVNSFVLIIQQKDNETLKLARRNYREASKKTGEKRKEAYCYKMEIRKLRELGKKLGASQTDIRDCFPLEKRRRSSLLNIILQTRRSSMPCIPDSYSSSEDSTPPHPPLKHHRSFSAPFTAPCVGPVRDSFLNSRGRMNLAYSFGAGEDIPEEAEHIQTKL